MSISKTVYATLKAEKDSGLTQTKLAEKHNVTQSMIQPLLSGTRSVEGMTLATLDKMFPNATINLNGNGITQFASNVRVNNQSVSLGKSADAFRDEVMKKIISLDLSGDDLKKVLTALMEVEV